MPYEYNEILEEVRKEVNGVGESTVNNIQNTLDRDEFIVACEAVVGDDTEPLKEVDGIGETLATNIGLYVSWEIKPLQK